jgi:glucose-6-phosphate 1-dehydrogenase
LTQAAVAPAATFVIFGVLGDLARRLLMPALVNLARDGLIDKTTRIIGVSYHDGNDKALRDALDDFVEKNSGWQKLAPSISYLKGDFTDPAIFKTLADNIDGNAVFYLATAPDFFGPLVTSIGHAGLLAEETGFRRVVIEKPFGRDFASAQALNQTLLAHAREAQLYRIDHFLGKETVQSLMVARFANPMLEAVWNGRYIDHVQITAAEAVAVGTRGKSYDTTGALRDMVPNHLFQLLAMVGMEPPNSFDAEAIRTEKAKVIDAVCPIGAGDAVRGRYTAGKSGGTQVKAYLEEAAVDPAGNTETYVAVKVLVETWRWAGVPFYLRTGKALSARDTEIVIQFRAPALRLFRDCSMAEIRPNRLVFQIQPNEAISAELVVKTPGPATKPTPISMDFRYADRFDLGHLTGYETLLYDVLMGDQTLFQRADQIEGGWRAVASLVEGWGNSGNPEEYAAGSAGPAAADALLVRDGRQWHSLG